MVINGKEYKQYDGNYFVSEDGDIWSNYSNKCLKHNIDLDGYHRVDIHQKHMKVHKLVFLTWIGKIDEGFQINHSDDNKDNNNYKNLYLGTQKENISDCINNQHRQGHIYELTVRIKSTGEIMTFCPAKEFFNFAGHSAMNGGIKRALTRDWFKKDYEVISYGKSVTTNPKLQKTEVEED